MSQDESLHAGTGQTAPAPLNPQDDAEQRPMRPFWTLWTGQAFSLVGSPRCSSPSSGG